jgi:hypothetical protein
MAEPAKAVAKPRPKNRKYQAGKTPNTSKGSSGKRGRKK